MGGELTSQGGVNSCEVCAEHAGQVSPEDGVAAVCALASCCCCSGRRRSVFHRPHSPLDALDSLRKLLQLDHYLHQKRRSVSLITTQTPLPWPLMPGHAAAEGDTLPCAQAPVSINAHENLCTFPRLCHHPY